MKSDFFWMTTEGAHREYENAKQIHIRDKAALRFLSCHPGSGTFRFHPDVRAALSHFAVLSAGHTDFTRAQSPDFADARHDRRQKNTDGAGRGRIHRNPDFDGLGFFWANAGFDHEHLEAVARLLGTPAKTPDQDGATGRNLGGKTPGGSHH